MTSTATAPEIVAFLGGAIAVRVAAAETGGSYSVLEQVLPGGMATPLHVHAREDETFVVLEGAVTVVRGDETLDATAGEVVRLPRGIPHAFRVDSERARIIDVVTPGGHEEFFRRAGEPAGVLDLIPVEGPPDMERMAAAARTTGLEILGPPPFGA